MRINKNTKRSPHHAMSFAAKRYVVTFLHNYAEENAILLPGCIPAYKRDDIKFLPSNRSKAVRYFQSVSLKHCFQIQSIWEYYCDCAKRTDIQVAAKTTFLSYWRALVPQIIVGKPMSDLCWTCQQNNALILKSINKPANEKTAVSYNNGMTDNAILIMQQNIKQTYLNCLH